VRSLFQCMLETILSRRENVILGKPITDVSHAAAYAKVGEVAACPASIKALARICKIHGSMDISECMAPIAHC
jgi:hypothetical protein